MTSSVGFARLGLVGLVLLRYYGFAEAPSSEAVGDKAGSDKSALVAGGPPLPVIAGQPTYEEVVRRAAFIHRVPVRLIRAVILAESGGDPLALSPKGAQGLMQLMPETARLLGVVDAFDSEQNIAGGVRYLRILLDRFGGDLTLALAAYNAGPGAVARYGGVPPFPETAAYLVRVGALVDGEFPGGAD